MNASELSEIKGFGVYENDDKKTLKITTENFVPKSRAYELCAKANGVFSNYAMDSNDFMIPRKSTRLVLLVMTYNL